MTTNELATRWIAFTRIPIGTAEHDRQFQVFEEVQEMAHRRPLDAWRFILDVLATTRDDLILANLAAGPLEDLLTTNGEAVVELLKVEARRSPEFRQILTGVWRNDISEAVWRAVVEAQSSE